MDLRDGLGVDRRFDDRHLGEGRPRHAARPRRQIADAIPGARFELVEGARHLAILERPDEVVPLILDHLDPEAQ